MTKQYLLFLMGFISFTILSLHYFQLKAEEITELENRVYNIEKKLNGKIPILPVDSKLLNISGYLSGQYSLLRGEGYKDGKSYDISRSQYLKHSFILSGNITKRTSYLFSPMFLHYEYLDNVNSVNRSNDIMSTVIVPRAYGIYRYNKHFNFQFGRFLSPSGHFIQSWDWVSGYLIDIKYIDDSPARGLIYNHITDGLNIYGVKNLGPTKLEYYLYGGYHNYTASRNIVEYDVYQIFHKAFPVKFFWGTRLKFYFLNNDIHFALSFQSGQRNAPFKSYGADFNFNYGALGFSMEYAKTIEEEVPNHKDQATIVNNLINAVNNNNLLLYEATQNDIFLYVDSRMDSDKNSFYIEPYYHLNSKWTMASRYEYFNARNRAYYNGDAINIYTLGIVYDPIPSLRFRLFAQKFDYKSKRAYGFFDETLENYPSAVGLLNADGNQLKYNKINPDYMIYHLIFILNF